ncbi:conserved hypothetical protein [Verticillium alfalfae VaMs.102]|uniref:Uncharacterized protein n=1 Tax=Verticillium alfalfae (strain VaMs.102 / ATCC MYA-4576 / FGSC 10136) TaxID=526221 RepID=C9SUN8_VERA1|nr:conserved hypothetical protein [Verticillium alfalfae VaMs.102]EEY22148.1 conserved hypothetical protein [Verticillium alfalfae VaMs.102]
MPNSSRRPEPRIITYSRPPRASTESCDSYETYHSESTAPTSIYASTQASVKEAGPVAKFQPVYEEDISPSTRCCPGASVDTFDSSLASENDCCREIDLESYDDNESLPLPVYHQRHLVDSGIPPSNAQDFAKLFPSMERLSIRHDDSTPDGNLNLRVDTVVPGRRRLAIQLFHLRMHDLARRDFSLRRYCRDSGREICSCKRQYDLPSHEERHGMQHSMTNALKALGGHRTLSHASAGIASSAGNVRPQSGTMSHDESPVLHPSNHSLSFQHQPQNEPVPTNTMKLEFSNYARVNISRRGHSGSKRYEFEWWGHSYQWRRVLDRNLGVVSFHLIQDGVSNRPVAHIVPETRSPNQVESDERAGDWVPPCHMWISDQSIIDAATNVADVVVATGLIALVDDCIKQRWQTGKHQHRFNLGAASTADHGPKAFVQSLFHRRSSEPHAQPKRHRRTVSIY